MIGDNLRRLRHARNLSQQDVASRSGLSVHTIERVERGEPCRPTTVHRVAHALDVHPDELDREVVAS